MYKPMESNFFIAHVFMYMLLLPLPPPSTPFLWHITTKGVHSMWLVQTHVGAQKKVFIVPRGYKIYIVFFIIALQIY